MAVENGKEQYAEEMAQVMNDLRLVLAKARDLSARYFDQDIDDEVNALESEAAILPGTAFDKATIVGTVTVLQQFLNFMDGQAVVQDTYRIYVNRAAALRTGEG